VRRRFLLRAVLLVAAPLVSARAQRPIVALTPTGRPIVACRGQRVDQLVIYSTAPTVANLQRVPWLAAVARTIHMTTRTEVVRRYLLLAPGDACDELRRAESERILRAQPFIAEAEVYVVPSDEGGVDLEVHTSDETAMVIGGGGRGRAPVLTSALLGNANIAGEGVYGSTGWQHGDGFRDGYSARLTDHQFLGKPITLGLEGYRNPIGGSWRVEAAHPYFTDLQRTAWRIRTGSQLDYVEIRRPDGERPLITLDRDFYDVGAIVRVGLPGYLGLVGMSVSGESSRSGTRLLDADTGHITDLGPVPVLYVPHRVGRVNLLLGIRGIRFVRMEGLDALAATQDLATGFQIGTQIGHSIGTLGATESDVSLAGDMYAGATTGRSTIRMQIQGEGRRALGTSTWDDVLTTGRVVHYLKLSPVHVNQIALEFSGGYRERVPFQLLLGVPLGGVRGYEEATFAGGQRLVARVEERYAFPGVKHLADIGVAFFADAGKQWAGDVPFGVTTSVKTSAGLSLLASVPSHSARMWRADLAFPTSGQAGARWTVRFTNVDRTTFEFRNPRDVADRRALTVPTSLFNWP
jgi:hypothetical protein